MLASNARAGGNAAGGASYAWVSAAATSDDDGADDAAARLEGGSCVALAAGASWTSARECIAAGVLDLCEARSAALAAAGAEHDSFCECFGDTGATDGGDDGALEEPASVVFLSFFLLLFVILTPVPVGVDSGRGAGECCSFVLFVYLAPVPVGR